MTSKERAKLKSVASNTETIMQIGKNPIGDAFIKQVRDALKARELIKIRVLETCEMLPREAADAISEAAGCETVQVIGSRIVLFKKRSGDDNRPSLLDEKQDGKERKNANDKSKQGKVREQRSKFPAEKKRKKSGDLRRGF